MIRARGRCVLAALAVLCSTGIVHAADQAPDAAPQPFDPAAVWREELAHGDPTAIGNTYLLESTLYGTDGKIDAGLCKAKAAEIDEALKTNPAGLAIWYVAYECAAALDDTTLAEQRLANFGALVRYGIETRPPDGERTPIRIVAERDADLFIKASGQTLQYAYYETFSKDRWMILKVSLWDAERNRERILAFDYLDTQIQLLRANPYAEFPVFRGLLGKRLIEIYADAWPDSAAGAARELQRAMSGTDAASRFAAVEAIARSGQFAATMTYEWGCLVGHTPGCAEKAVDLMLPWAESSNGMVLVSLALAYEQGQGVDRDHRKAKKLIEGAERRLGSEMAHDLFVTFSLVSQRGNGLNALAQDIVDKDAAAHVPFAEFVVANMEYTTLRGKSLGTDALAMLRHAAAAGFPAAQGLLGRYLCEHGQVDDGLGWMRAAATVNDAISQRTLAKKYEDGDGVEKNLELARKWYAEAGRSGDAKSMVWMGRYYKAEADTKETRFREANWFRSATLAGDLDGSLELAALYVKGGEGVEGDATKAVVLYRALDKAYDNATARRELAFLLATSDKVPHDLVEARRLLAVDADRGDEESRSDLGELMMHGSFGEDQKAPGRRMLEEAAAQGNVHAMMSLGTTLYYSDKPERRAGLELWQHASEKGNPNATNNVAWALCTAPEESLRDAARGLAIAKVVGENDAAPIAFKDTLAACYAATGDFEKAEAIEKAAIAVANARQPPLETFAKNASARMELFHKREVFIEKPGT